MTLRILFACAVVAGVLSPQQIVIVKKKAAGPSYLFSETFDGATLCATGYGSTCDNTWTLSASGDVPVFDYATSPAPLQGSYSLKIPPQTRVMSIPVSGHTGGTLYSTCILSATAGISTGMHVLRTSGGAVIGQALMLWSTDHFYVRLYYNSGGSNASDATLSIGLGQKWYFKVEYTPGTGANAVWNVYAVQDSGGFPGWGSARITRTNGTDTALVGEVAINPASAGQTSVIDGIRLSLSDITY